MLFKQTLPTLCKRYILFTGCEDIIIEGLSPQTLCSVLEWSSQPHGSNWAYKQALQYLQDEFISIAQSEAFSSLSKKYLVEILKSDFLQVTWMHLQV